MYSIDTLVLLCCCMVSVMFVGCGGTEKESNQGQTSGESEEGVENAKIALVLPGSIDDQS